MPIQLGFVAEWWIATVIGVFIGTFLGADHIGLVQHVPGDFLFGLSIGLAQFPVLYRYLPKRDNRLFIWIIASAIAFPISVVLGRRAVSYLGTSQDMLNFSFGVGMGIGHGIIQAIAIRIFLPSASWRFLIWIPTAVIGWIATEVISLGINYTQALALPTGIALGLITAIGWLLIFKPVRSTHTPVTISPDGYRTTDQSGG